MSSPAINTVIAMMESLPDNLQEQVVEHLREYIADLEDERKWDKSFKKTQQQLINAARRAKQEIAEGKAKPLAEEIPLQPEVIVLSEKDWEIVTSAIENPPKLNPRLKAAIKHYKEEYKQK